MGYLSKVFLGYVLPLILSEPTPTLVYGKNPKIHLKFASKCYHAYTKSVSLSTKSLHFLGLIWSLRGLALKGEGMSVGAVSPWSQNIDLI